MPVLTRIHSSLALRALIISEFEIMVETSGPIVIVGSINMDLVVRSEYVPDPGQTVLDRDCSTVPGGKGREPGRRSGPARESCVHGGTSRSRRSGHAASGWSA